jgi:DNA (cytosine-5)-methyltransferase 1
MLKPSELALAQGFPADYKFAGKTAQIVKQIGNAVPKNLAKALAKSAIQIL